MTPVAAPRGVTQGDETRALLTPAESGETVQPGGAMALVMIDDAIRGTARLISDALDDVVRKDVEQVDGTLETDLRREA